MAKYRVKTELTCSGAIIKEYYELESKRKLAKEKSHSKLEYRNEVKNPGQYLDVFWWVQSGPATVEGKTIVTKVGDPNYRKEHDWEVVEVQADGKATATKKIRL